MSLALLWRNFGSLFFEELIVLLECFWAWSAHTTERLGRAKKNLILFFGPFRGGFAGMFWVIDDMHNPRVLDLEGINWWPDILPSCLTVGISRVTRMWRVLSCRCVYLSPGVFFILNTSIWPAALWGSHDNHVPNNILQQWFTKCGTMKNSETWSQCVQLMSKLLVFLNVNLTDFFSNVCATPSHLFFFLKQSSWVQFSCI